MQVKCSKQSIVRVVKRLGRLLLCFFEHFCYTFCWTCSYTFCTHLLRFFCRLWQICSNTCCKSLLCIFVHFWCAFLRYLIYSGYTLHFCTQDKVFAWYCDFFLHDILDQKRELGEYQILRESRKSIWKVQESVRESRMMCIKKS